ncbi:hypothetical protein M407DRAFT_17364 [Tulasnella calospora MUT 4182]|uniref:RED-like N-terminal domain-containing protein n=1 Tax=Tulasnella calospora MUT 4182 TaxID=1051891 RepID=A0A0C3LID4_9AGAM|nr:hypothetical protein M407DRAFT_17364 [Tulasnella calospora MUT 4182]
MDQDSFRTLLSRPGSSQAGSAPPTNSRPSILQAGRRKKEPPPPPPIEATFKPRKVAKLPPGYRDRAAERRETADEFAEGAAKGLNLELLEKVKAGDDASIVDDDALEEAFKAAAASETPSESANVPKKRTRDDLLKALKNKREESTAAPMEVEGPSEAKSLEAAKSKGKFRPIGQPAAETKAKEEKRKKKKRKVVTEAHNAEPPQAPAPLPTTDLSARALPAANLTESHPEPSTDTPQAGPSKPPPATILPDDDGDIDIFADVGEYEGVDLGDDSEDDKPPSTRKEEKDESSVSDPPKRVNWFGEAEPEPPVIFKPRPPTPPVPEKEEGEEEEPVRLAPLASSSIHDIKSFLEVDKALEKEEKRKALKEKKKKQQP